MQELQGGSNTILTVNLTTQTSSTREITIEELELFLGGKGLGLMLYAETAQPHTPPLSPQNPLLLLTGTLTGTGAPNSGRFSAVTRSPLTGLMASSSCGGPFGMALKTAGYDGLILTGAASTPVYLVIHPDRVEFLDAASLWGLDTDAAQEKLAPGRKDGALVIGPAGENLVLYANAVSGHRHLGRAGFGAVLGFKNVKAILAKGGVYKIVPQDPAGFQKARKKANLYINRNPATSEMYREKGTNAHVLLSNLGGILPVHNFQENHHPDAQKVSGEFFKEQYNTTPSACRPCTVLCGHKGTYPDGVHEIPEYETTALFGPNLGLFDPELITKINDRCRQLGIDTISTAGTLAYWMEASQRGLVKSPLRFDSGEGILDVLDTIAAREGIGDDLADGSRHLAGRLGGIEFAAQVKGLEIAAYDPRGAYGQGLGFAVANRGGCHLSATMFPLEVYFNFLNPYHASGKAVFVRFFEDLFNGINSIGTCIFTVFAYILESPIAKYTPHPVLSFAMKYLSRAVLPLMDVSLYSRMYSTITGIQLSPGKFLKAGERITVLERTLNTIEGVSVKEDILPSRFLEPSSHGGKTRSIPLKKMRSMYYRLRGYDAAGIPTRKTLDRLQLRSLVESYTCKAVQADIPKERIPVPEYTPEILPGKALLKSVFVKAILFVLGRALQYASKIDPVIQQEVQQWPEGYKVVLKVQPDGPGLGLERTSRRRLHSLGSRLQPEAADMVIYFKNLESAFLIFTTQISTAGAQAQHRLSLQGDIALSMSLIRVLDRIETYLFPRFLAQRAVKRLPSIPVLKLHWNRIRIYALGVLLGF